MQKVAQILSLCIYPALHTVPTVGLLYLTSSSATAWLVFRILPSMLHSLQGRQPGSPETITTDEVSPSASTSAAVTTALPQDALSGSSSEATPAIQTTRTATSSGSSGSAPLPFAVTTSNSTLPALERSNDVEFLVNTCILSHARNRPRASPPPPPQVVLYLLKLN